MLFFVGVNFLIKSLIMTKEKCWKCKKVKANVRLRATDDRLCEACFEANEEALRQIQLGDNMAAASVIVNEPCSVTPKAARQLFTCDSCHQSVSEILRCDVCENTFDQQCAGIPYDSFTTLVSIVGDTGWICQICRNENKTMMMQLKAALATTNETVAELKVVIAQMSSEIDSLKVSRTCTEKLPTERSGEKAAKPNGSASDIAVEVHRTLAEKDKRKCNIVISGLPEADTLDGDDIAKVDEQNFAKLCEEHFTTKPVVSHLGCRRLGKLPDNRNRPRKLLVHLSSESAARELLAEAKRLRLSDIPAVADNVYINPDLCSAELQLAFERRKARRESRRSHNKQRTDVNTELPRSVTSTATGEQTDDADQPPSDRDVPSRTPAIDGFSHPTTIKQRTVVNSSFRAK